jgi:hypothetical protein
MPRALRRPGGRSVFAVLAVLTSLVLAGCQTPPTPDPALVDALSQAMTTLGPGQADPQARAVLAQPRLVHEQAIELAAHLPPATVAAIRAGRLERTALLRSFARVVQRLQEQGRSAQPPDLSVSLVALPAWSQAQTLLFAALQERFQHETAEAGAAPAADGGAGDATTALP